MWFLLSFQFQIIYDFIMCLIIDWRSTATDKGRKETNGYGDERKATRPTRDDGQSIKHQQPILITISESFLKPTSRYHMRTLLVWLSSVNVSVQQVIQKPQVLLQTQLVLLFSSIIITDFYISIIVITKFIMCEKSQRNAEQSLCYLVPSVLGTLATIMASPQHCFLSFVTSLSFLLIAVTLFAVVVHLLLFQSLIIHFH